MNLKIQTILIFDGIWLLVIFFLNKLKLARLITTLNNKNKNKNKNEKEYEIESLLDICVFDTV